MTDIVETAKKRFDEAMEFWGASRELSKQAIDFSYGDTFNGNQYLDMYGISYTQERRESEGLLTINITDPACKKIVNTVRMNRPQAKIMPGDNEASLEAAEIVEKWSRAIKSKSNADDATDTAVEFQVRGGEGYFEVCLDYESEDSFQKIPQFKPIRDPFCVLLDPQAIKSVDGTTARWGFKLEEIRKDRIEMEYGKDPSDWENDGKWVKTDTCIIAKYYYCDTTKSTLYQYTDDTTGFDKDANEVALDDKGKPIKRTVYRDQWTYCVLLGGEPEPVHKEEWYGGFVPYCPVWGQLFVDRGGVPYLKGEAHNLIDQNRVINYMASKGVESIAKQETTPWKAAIESIPQVSAEKDTWRMLASGNSPYALLYRAYDDAGKPLPQPEKERPAITPSAEFTAMQTFLEFAHNATGQFSAPGEVSPTASGKAMNARQQQADVATFHYPDNLGRALRYAEQILINLFPHVTNDGDVIRLLNIDGTEEKAEIRSDIEQPYQEPINKQNALGVKHMVNPDMLGKLDVVISIGPSYQTQRQEASDKVAELVQKNPAIWQTHPDLVIDTLELPNKQAWIDRFKKTMPPELIGEEEGDPAQQLAQMQMEMEQMQAALQGAEEHVKGLEAQNQELQMQAAQSEAKAITTQIQSKRFELSTLEKQSLEPMPKKAGLDHEGDEIVNENETIDHDYMNPQLDEVIFKLEEQTAMLAQGQEAIAANLAKPKRKTIQITSPSGKVYTGESIEE